MSCIQRAFLIAIFATGFITAKSQASVERIFLSRGEGIHPQTGVRSPIYLNPTGEVNVTYSIAGARLTYVDARGQTETIEIYADYPQPPSESDGSLSRYNAQMKLSIETGGKGFPVEIIKIWAHLASQVDADAPKGTEPGRLLLKFNGQGRVGFNPAYGLSDVLMVAPKGQKTLDAAIHYTLDFQIREQMQQEDAAARKAAEAVTEAAPKRYPVGFITPSDAVAAPMCAQLFVSGR